MIVDVWNFIWTAVAVDIHIGSIVMFLRQDACDWRSSVWASVDIDFCERVALLGYS